MYKISEKIKRKITFSWVAIIISITATAVISGLFIGNLITKLSVNKTTEATYIEQHYEKNSDNKEIYKPIYHYVVNEKEYVCESTYVVHSDEIKAGTVHYNSNNPQKCMIDYSYNHFSSPYLLLLVVAFFIFCLIMAIKSLKDAKKQTNMVEYLQKNGKLVKGVPHEIKKIGTAAEDFNDTVIVSKYKFPDGKTRTIKSEAMTYIKATKESVDLLYDPKNCDINYLGVNIKIK